MRLMHPGEISEIPFPPFGCVFRLVLCGVGLSPFSLSEDALFVGEGSHTSNGECASIWWSTSSCSIWAARGPGEGATELARSLRDGALTAHCSPTPGRHVRSSLAASEHYQYQYPTQRRAESDAGAVKCTGSCASAPAKCCSEPAASRSSTSSTRR